jgi:hypothetical protein
MVLTDALQLGPGGLGEAVTLGFLASSRGWGQMKVNDSGWLTFDWKCLTTRRLGKSGWTTRRRIMLW